MLNRSPDEGALRRNPGLRAHLVVRHLVVRLSFQRGIATPDSAVRTAGAGQVGYKDLARSRRPHHDIDSGAPDYGAGRLHPGYGHASSNILFT
jgi:hypothetical protein